MVRLEKRIMKQAKKHFIFCKNQLLLEKHYDSFRLPNFSDLTSLIKNIDSYLIGHYNQHDCFAVDVQSIEITEKYEWISLRSALEKIGSEWFGAAARAYQIVQWDNNHRYCGRCGSDTEKIHNQFERQCHACHLSFFPKISPAVIVLIKKDNQILMARQKSFPEGVYGLIAGFAEAGESLEETVHREVYEEVGIQVKNIAYFGSQSWPFPDSLMIGFTAEHKSGDIHCRDGELECAGWYDAGHLPGYPSSSTSIALTMINDFLKSHKKEIVR